MPRLLTRSIGLAAAMLLTLLTAAAFAAPPAGARTIYWVNAQDDSLMAAPLEGGTPQTLMAGASFGELALDRQSARIYWTNWPASEIHSVALDGSDERTLALDDAWIYNPSGVVIDPAARRIYWINNSEGAGSIGWASLDDAGVGGILDTGAEPSDAAVGIAFDSVKRRLYWTNNGGNDLPPVGWFSVDGGGSGHLGEWENFSWPDHIAVSRDGAQLYVIAFSEDEERLVLLAQPVDGSAPQVIDHGSINPFDVNGVAVDPLTGLIYVTNWDNSSLDRVNPAGGAESVISNTQLPWGNPVIGYDARLDVGGPSPSDLGDPPLGGSTTTPITITSGGPDPLRIDSIVPDGPGFGVLPGSDCLGREIPAGGSCTVLVTFTPTGTGSSSGSLVITSTLGVQRHPLAGRGVVAQTVLSRLRAVKRCAAPRGAGGLSFKFTLSRAQQLTATLSRQTRLRGPRRCPAPQTESAFGGATSKLASKKLSGVAGTQTRTLAKVFKTKRLAPGHYRLQLSYKLASGATERRTVWFWVLR